MEAVAQAIAACLLETYDPTKATSAAVPQPAAMPAINGSGWLDTPANFIDDTAAILAVAEQFGAPHKLAAAVADERGTLGERPTVTSVTLAPPVLPHGFIQSPSAFGAPLEGALVGSKPFLFPWPPAAVLVSVFAWAVLQSVTQEQEVLAARAAAGL